MELILIWFHSAISNFHSMGCLKTFFSQMILILLHFAGRTIESVGFIGNLLYFSQSSGDDLDLVTFCHQQLLLPSVWCQVTLET